MPLEKVVLFPHPPIALPEVAGPRFKEVEKTANGMLELSKTLVAGSPELVVVITPHAQLHPSAFSVYVDQELTSSFANFGAPQVQFTLKNNFNFIKKLEEVRKNSAKNDLVGIKSFSQLDHGSGVPLYYLVKAGYKGDIVVINYSYAPVEKHMDFGKSIMDTANLMDEKVILLASGDLSHRITPSAPAGYHPDGKKFDKFLVEYVEKGQYSNIIDIETDLRNNAGECAFNSLMVAFGAIETKAQNNKVFSYEAPFGVGYLVASL